MSIFSPETEASVHIMLKSRDLKELGILNEDGSTNVESVWCQVTLVRDEEDTRFVHPGFLMELCFTNASLELC